MMMPLDVTHQAITTPDRLERFRELPGDIGRACHGMLSFYSKPRNARFAGRGGPLHDPCVIAYLLKPSLFQGDLRYVAVETQSELTKGMTVTDWWGATKGATPNVTVHQLDDDGFYELLLKRLANLSG